MYAWQLDLDDKTYVCSSSGAHSFKRAENFSSLPKILGLLGALAKFRIRTISSKTKVTNATATGFHVPVILVLKEANTSSVSNWVFIVQAVTGQIPIPRPLIVPSCQAEKRPPNVINSCITERRQRATPKLLRRSCRPYTQAAYSQHSAVLPSGTRLIARRFQVNNIGILISRVKANEQFRAILLKWLNCTLFSEFRKWYPICFYQVLLALEVSSPLTVGVRVSSL